jgi:hypothetical protein
MVFVAVVFAAAAVAVLVVVVVSSGITLSRHFGSSLCFMSLKTESRPSVLQPSPIPGFCVNIRHSTSQFYTPAH